MKRSNKVIAVELDQTLVPTLDTFLAWHNDTYDTDMTMANLYDNNIRDLTRMFGGTKEDGCAKLREFYDSAAFSNMTPLKYIDDGDDCDTNIDESGNLGIGQPRIHQQQQQWGALEVLQSLKKRKWALVIVTYRPQFTQAVTQQFIDRHYPGLFDGIYYCNQGLSVADQLDMPPKPIAVMCQEIGANYLIDDSLEHCLDCSMLDMTLLLYDHHGKYTYNHLLPQKRPRYGRPTLTSSSKQLYQRSASSRSSLASLPENVIRVKSWKQILDQFPMPTSPLRFCHYPATAINRTPAANQMPSTSTSATHRNKTTSRITLWNHGKRRYDQMILSDENDGGATDSDDEYNDTSDHDDDSHQADDEYQSPSWNDRDAITV